LGGAGEGRQEEEERKEFQRIQKKPTNNTNAKLNHKHFEVLPYQPMHKKSTLLLPENKISKEQLRQPHAKIKGSPVTSAALGRGACATRLCLVLKRTAFATLTV